MHTVGLAEAREKARDCRRLRLDGTDPIEATKATRTPSVVYDMLRRDSFLEPDLIAKVDSASAQPHRNVAIAEDRSPKSIQILLIGM